MVYRLLANGIVLLHGAYLAYVVLGGVVALRWPRTLPAHVATVAWGALVVAASVRCPLTSAEDWLRRRGGETPPAGGFIDRYVEDVLYPARLTPLVHALVGALVLACWLTLLVRRSQPAGSPRGTGHP
jgi:hypothetical protein